MIPPGMVPEGWHHFRARGKAANPGPDPGIWGARDVFSWVVLLRTNPLLGDFWFFCMQRLVGWARARFWGGLGAAMASLRARLGSTVALPRHSGMLLAAPHSSWHPHDHPGLLQGPWDGPQMDLGLESHRGQPGATRSRRLSRPWELFGAKPLYNPRAVVSPPVTGCSQAQQGAGSDLKKGEFPHSHPARRKGCVAPH